MTLYIKVDSFFFFFECFDFSYLLTVTLLFVWFLTELGQAEGKVGLGETERLLGGQESNSKAGRGRRES